MGISIPINAAKRVAREIITTGSATHGQLGLSVQDKMSGTSSEFTAGATVKITLERGGQEQTAAIALGAAATG